MEEAPRRTLGRTPFFFPLVLVLCLIGVETEGFLDYQGRAGIMSIVRWNLRLVMFGVELRKVLETTCPSISVIVSDTVRMRFGCGSDVVRMWFGRGFGRGSDVVRTWFGSGSEGGSDVFSDLVQKVWQKFRESGFQQFFKKGALGGSRRKPCDSSL